MKFVLVISKALNKHVIVEGVETQMQEKILLEHGVTYVQGYFYSKARKPQDLTQVFKDYPFVELDFDNN